MLKKLSIVIALALLFAAAISVTAYAAPGDDIAAIVDRANTAIANEINRAVHDANELLDEYKDKVDFVNHLNERGWISDREANRRISFLTDDFESDLDRIADRLIYRTDAIVDDVIREARRYNITICKEYVQVNLAGHIYMVDPLRIVGN